MTNRLPPLIALRTFITAANHLSLTRAGEELHVTHSAVRHQIRNLEEWFKVPLFRREGRGLRLTQPGQSLYDALSPLFMEMGNACQRIKAINNLNSLSIGCIPSIASRWLIPRLDRFSQRYPEVDIHLVYARTNERLGGSPLDILITFVEDESQHVIGHHLFSRTNKPVCSPAFLKKYGPFTHPEQIASAPLLHDEDREGWKKWCEIARVTPNSALSGPVYQDFNLLATAVLAGHGIGLCPVNVVQQEIRNGELIVLSNIATDSNKGYYLLIKDEHSQLVDHFVAWFFADVVQRSRTENGA